MTIDITIEDFEKNKPQLGDCSHCDAENVMVIIYTIPPTRGFSIICENCFRRLILKEPQK